MFHIGLSFLTFSGIKIILDLLFFQINLTNARLILRNLIYRTNFTLPKDYKVISVIIATYNAESYIRDCLQSIYMQSYTDYEVIIVDGQSKDNTLNIINEFTENLHNWVVISEKDNGLYDAWNKAVKLSNGEWITFIGADDQYYNSKSLAVFAKSIIDDKKPFYYGRIACIGSNENVTGYRGSKWISPWSIKLQHFQFGVTFPIMTCIFNRKFIQGEMFDLNYKVVADVDLVLRCLKKWDGQPPVFIENEAALVIMGYGGVSTNYRTHILTLKEAYSVRKKNGISNFNSSFFYRVFKVYLLNAIYKLFGDKVVHQLIKTRHRFKSVFIKLDK